MKNKKLKESVQRNDYYRVCAVLIFLINICFSLSLLCVSLLRAFYSFFGAKNIHFFVKTYCNFVFRVI